MEIVGAALGLAASGQAAKAHKEAGRANAVELRDQAKQAESKAKGEELIRLQNLRQALSTQKAYWAAAGIDSSTGSATTISNVSKNNFELDQGTALINTRSLIRSFNNKAENSIKIAKYKARGSLLTGFANFTSAVANSAKPTSSSRSSGNPHQ